MTAPAARYFNAFKSFILREKHLLKGEQGFLKRKDDLIALQEGQERGWLDEIIESTLESGIPETVMNCNLRFALNTSISMITLD